MLMAGMIFMLTTLFLLNIGLYIMTHKGTQILGDLIQCDIETTIKHPLMQPTIQMPLKEIILCSVRAGAGARVCILQIDLYS